MLPTLPIQLGEGYTVSQDVNRDDNPNVRHRWHLASAEKYITCFDADSEDAAIEQARRLIA